MAAKPTTLNYSVSEEILNDMDLYDMGPAEISPPIVSAPAPPAPKKENPPPSADIYREFLKYGLETLPVEARGKKTWMDFTKMTTDDMMERWRGGMNLGILGGRRSGVTILDIDVKDRGLEIWDALMENNTDLESFPWTIVTGSGGLHMFFEYNPNLKMGDHCAYFDGKKIGWDIRNDDSYVVSPGSVHSNGNLYVPKVSLTEYMAGGGWTEMPQWLEDVLTKKSEISKEWTIVPRAVEEKKRAEPGEKKEYKYINLDYVTKCLDMLKPERSVAYGDWSNVLWAIKGTAIEYKLELRELAHSFSKKCGYKYRAADVDHQYDRSNEDLEGLTFGSIRAWANEDNPTEYKRITELALDANRPPPSEGFWRIRKQLVIKKGLTVEDVEEWMRSCIYQIYEGDVYMIRYKTGFKRIQYPFSGNMNISLKVEGKKGKQVNLRYADILKDLQTKSYFTDNIFNKVDFIPTPGKPEYRVGETFNIFAGWANEAIECKESDVELWLDHLRETLCGGHIEHYEYVLNWMAHLLQFPAIKISTGLIFRSSQGVGKNLFWDDFFGVLDWAILSNYQQPGSIDPEI